MNISSLSLLALIVLLTVRPTELSAASSIDFSYADLASDATWMGTITAESYDIAIKIDGNQFGGCTIESVSVPLPLTASEATDARIWLSSKLSLSSGKNMPDILTLNARRNGDYIYADLPEVIEVPEEGIFIGYSFTVIGSELSERQQNPVATRNGVHEYGLYLHTSRSIVSWQSYSASMEQVSAIRVTLSGDTGNGYALPGLPEEINYDYHDSTISLPLSVTAFTTEPVHSLKLSYSIDGENEQTLVASLDAPVEIQYGTARIIDLTLERSLPKGVHRINLSLDEINGKSNISPAAGVAGCDLYALEFLPVHRPLMEEYTAFTCGWCPRGSAAMEHMASLYPDNFICLAYHANDRLSPISTDEMPFCPETLPCAFIDRRQKIDPYHGFDKSGFGLEKAWLQFAAEFVPADISLSAVWLDDYEIEVDTRIYFVKEYPADCYVEYIIVANGLSDPTFKQHNYFGGISGYDDIDEMQPYITGDAELTDLVFNYVPVMRHTVPDAIGNGMIQADSEFNKHCSLDAGCLKSVRGITETLITTNTRLVAVLHSADGKILNAAKCNVSPSSDVAATYSDNDYTVTYFDLTGRRVARPSDGIYIRHKNYRDGTHISDKILLH